jgi:NAD(P)-dependent dehydrogenase (short-subunit alcohol dehydrogenase family)
MITGCSRGIGLEMTKQLLADPSTEAVIATARAPEQSTQLAELSEQHKERLLVLPLTVTDPESIKVEVVVELCGEFSQALGASPCCAAAPLHMLCTLLCTLCS